jgi:hypothetical protein
MNDWVTYVTWYYSLTPGEQDQQWARLSPDQRRAFMEAHQLLSGSGLSTTRSQPSTKKDWIGLQHLPRLIFILVLFGGGNIALYYGQEWWHRDEQHELDRVRSQLAQLRSTIRDQEAHLTELKTRLDALDAQIASQNALIESYEAQAIGGGLPSAVYDQYTADLNTVNASVDSYNLSLAAYRELASQYDANIKAYNALVERANQLARQVGTRFYLKPGLGH